MKNLSSARKILAVVLLVGLVAVSIAVVGWVTPLIAALANWTDAANALEQSLQLVATTGTSTATYTITNTTTGAVSAPVVVPDYPTDKPVTISVPGIPGLSFDIKGNPANGDTVTLQPSASMFSTLDSAINGIRNAPNNNGAIQAVGQALANMDVGLERLHNIRGFAGELLNRADRITGDQEKRSIQLEGDRSRAEDLDMIKGISDFQNQQVGYEAALKSYAQVQKLSLFNFIG